MILGAASVGIVFVLLPFSDIFTSEPRKEMQVRTVETVRMRPDPPEMKPPDREESAEPEDSEQAEVKDPEPTNEKPQEMESTASDPSLELSTPEVGGDFSMDFDHSPAPSGGSADDPDQGPDVSSGPFGLEEVDSGPRAVKQMRPAYPYRARRRGREGWVEVEFTVTPEGEVEDVSIVDSEGGGEFEKSAKEVLSRWEFEPGRRDGREVPVVVRTTFNFELE